MHSPLEGLLTWVLLRLGWGETARRLVPVALGIATVLLLARWTGRRFGRRAALATGAFAALAPLHVHYSQELRPYSLALFRRERLPGLCVNVSRFPATLPDERER